MKNTLALTILAAAGAAANAQTYTVTRLIDLPDARQSWALDLNDAGQVAGSYMTDGWKRCFGFVWQEGSVGATFIAVPGDGDATPDEILSPAHQVEVTAINESGVVAGQAMSVAGLNGSRITIPFFSPTPANDPPRLLSAAVLGDSVVEDLTDTEPMLSVGWGWSGPPEFPIHGYGVLLTVEDGLGDPPVFDSFGGLAGAASGATAMAANGARTVVGGVQNDDNRLVAYRRDWDVKSIETLGTLGGPSSEALDINDTGQIVGWAHIEPGLQHAFLYEGGVMIDLGTLGGPNSTARGLNEHGRIVGESWTAGGEVHAFIHDGSTMSDLNDLIADGSGWILQRAHAINNRGWIVGEGWIGGESHAFLLRPIECPADIDGDGDADADDFFGYLDAFSAGDPAADLDMDGDIDVDDFFAYLELFVADGC